MCSSDGYGVDGYAFRTFSCCGADENSQSQILVVGLLYSSSYEVQWAGYEEIGKAAKQAWLRLFSKALTDCVNVK